MATNIVKPGDGGVASRRQVPKRPKLIKPGDQNPRHVSAVLEAELIRALDDEAKRLSEELGLTVTRTDVMRKWLRHAMQCPDRDG